MPGHHFSHFPNQKILGDEYFKSHAIKMFLIWLIWMNAEWWCRLYYHHHCRYLIINLIGICKLNWSVGENYRLYHNDLIMIQSQLARQVMGDKSGPVVFLSDDSRKPMNIHPCSNSIVPIHGRSEYVKKLWNMYNFHFSCFFFWIDMNYFNPSMLVLYLPIPGPWPEWFVSESPFVETWSLWWESLCERLIHGWRWEKESQIFLEHFHKNQWKSESFQNADDSNWCVVAADAPNNWQLMPVRHVTISTIAPH